MKRDECIFRHENGNCLAIGGFCFNAVSESICNAIRNAYERGKIEGIKEASSKEQRKHGHWIDTRKPVEKILGIKESYQCSRCECFDRINSNYCSCCGTKMDERISDETN